GRRVSLDDSGRLPVAKLVAVKKEARPEERIAAIERIKKLASGLSLGGLKVKDLISEGPPMSKVFVVDCSIAMAWLFHDEATPKTAALLNRLATETALVPGWWFIEITNVLAIAEQKLGVGVLG